MLPWIILDLTLTGPLLYDSLSMTVYKRRSSRIHGNINFMVELISLSWAISGKVLMDPNIFDTRVVKHENGCTFVVGFNVNEMHWFVSKRKPFYSISFQT